jgi:hypothetical protein
MICNLCALLLKKHYLDTLRELDSQPREIEAMKAQELTQLNQQLQQIGKDFWRHIEDEVNLVVTNGDAAFEEDFCQLKTIFNLRGVRGAISPALYLKGERRDTWTPRARRRDSMSLS